MTPSVTTSDAVTRVMVRYRLPAGSSHPMTDVIGTLEASDEHRVTVTDRHGIAVRIEREAIVAMKELPPRPVRTSEIRSLETAIAWAWPGTQQHWVDGWLLRFGHGVTHRANSAVRLDDQASPTLPDAAYAWFAERGVGPRVLLPDRLGTAPENWNTVLQSDVLVCRTVLESPVRESTVVTAEPDTLWLRGYGRGDNPHLVAVIEAVNGNVRFLRDRVSGAVARVAVTDAPDGRRWVGLFCLEVPPDRRREGHGTALCRDALALGGDLGATGAYLQVECGNLAAHELYRTLGFVPHHRYRFAEPVTAG